MPTPLKVPVNGRASTMQDASEDRTFTAVLVDLLMRTPLLLRLGRVLRDGRKDLSAVTGI